MSDIKHVKLGDYSEKSEGLSVYSLTAKPSFSPIDINMEFLTKDGWSASGDRIRFHIPRDTDTPPDHPLAVLLGSVQPHLLIRRYDREEDCLAAIRVQLDGTIRILSNDSAFAHRYLRGLFLEMPPSFHGQDSMTTTEE